MNWPQGIRAGVASCGIKEDGLDVGVLVAGDPCAWAGVFTQNAAAAAPVTWSKSLLGSSLKAIVANSGNANACTGHAGESAARATALAASVALGCEPNEIALASTGPIGVELAVDRLTTGVESCVADLGAPPLDFARSIMTTDTKPKLVEARCGSARVLGVAKGAAMIAPNMATMLAFVVTDAAVDATHLQSCLSAAADASFNRVSIDGCESTNDSVFALATGRVGVAEEPFARCVEAVCVELARQIACDAEGSARSMRIAIDGARSTQAAVAFGKGVASSALWRTAVNGSDPNWGRIVAALGSVDNTLDLSEVEVSIGAEQVFSRGEP
ncbi:MAG: glutamate N-acetyltransferase / amino-acid N-acetyltransferase, partial [Actinomycetota bacterium]|nr:glutamate N-acetyltransferase / amino-acid N-acetyltransferase [Actinomycetota bacterium]